MNFVYHVEGGDFTNAGSTSSQVKRMLKKIGVSPEIVKKTVVALYEAEVNIVAHAYRGDITVDLEEDHIKIVLADEGPGIPIKNNSDSLNITSEVGKGTTIELINYFQ